MVPPHSAEERLLKIGEDIRLVADVFIFPVFVETLLWTLYSVLFVIHCVKQRNHQHRRSGIFALCVSLYILCTVCWALDFSIMWTDLYQYIPESLSGGMTVSGTELYLKLQSNRPFAREMCLGFVFAFCDVVTLWRTYVIYGRPRWLAVCSICLFCLSSALYLLVGIFDIAQLLEDPPSFVINVHFMVKVALGLSAFSATILAHGFSTTLIARKAWIHRRRLRYLIDTHAGNRSDYKPMIVLYTVIESGVVYTSLWVVYVLVGRFSDVGNVYRHSWMVQVSGMYPTLVVVIVYLSTVQPTERIVSIFGGHPPLETIT